jgi:hypothetical protein
MCPTAGRRGGSLWRFRPIQQAAATLFRPGSARCGSRTEPRHPRAMSGSGLRLAPISPGWPE